MGGFFFNSVRLHMAHDDLEHFDDGKVTVGERVWYFINGLAAVSPQIYLYHSIFGINFFDTYYLYVVVTTTLRTGCGIDWATPERILLPTTWSPPLMQARRMPAKSKTSRRTKESRLIANLPPLLLCTTTCSSCPSSCSSVSISSPTSLLLSDMLSP